MGAHSQPRGVPARGRSTLVLLVAATAGYSLLEAMLVPALPVIQQAVGASPASIAWVFTGLLLAAAVTTPLVGRLAEVRDKRSVLFVVLLIVSLGTLVAGAATSVTVLAVGQVLQGVGLGLVPLSLGIIRDTQPPARVKSGNGLVVGASAVGSAVGFVVAGPLLEALGSHRWLYGIPFVLLVVITVGTWWAVPSCPPTARGRVDRLGAVVLSVGLLALLIGLTQAPVWGWLSAEVLGLGVIATVMLATFVLLELRTIEPLVSMRLLARPTVAAVCLIVFVTGFVVTATQLTISTIVAAPASTGYGLEESATTAGLILLPMGIVGTVAAPLTGRLERLLSARGVMALAGGAIVASCATLLVARGEPGALAASAMLVGFGLGIGVTQAMNTVVTAVPVSRVASVAGAAFVIRSVGSTLGGQVSGGILAGDLLPDVAVPSWSAFSSVFAVAAVLAVVALLLSRALPGRRSASIHAAAVRILEA
ncbi:MFS transporter [Pseudonocardia thermophila]|jgi:Arabinose efflux permease|uniref:MFS transporter n=1 Tax=Pseudonocardia thermophila TaxID=1848 RepID=UPI00248DCE46|nr:MFS transporter [Pseudonocardia thermophila]